MAEETVAAAPTPVIPAPPPEVVVVAEDTKEKTPQEEAATVAEVDTDDKAIKADDESAIGQSVSLKEESNRVSDLEDPEKKALDEFKLLIQDALNKHDFTLPPPALEEKTPPTTEEEPPKATTDESAEATITPPAAVDEEKKEVIKKEETPAPVAAAPEDDDANKAEAVVAPAPEEVLIWGIPLLGDEKSDTILLKFLRARDFKVNEAFTMLRNTVLWRKEFGIQGLLHEDLGTHLDKVVFMNGFDKEGHPVCYNVYGKFQNKELYHKTFSDQDKFLRWRIQFLEKSIQKLDFSPGGICTIVQVNDLKNSPRPPKTELRQATNQALSILQDNYPEFVAKQIFINVPWWYLAFNKMISPFLTLRTKSKFVFSGPSKSAETLFEYVAPEQVPVQYGGLNKEGEQEFSTADAVTEVIVKPATKHTVEIPVTEELELINSALEFSMKITKISKENIASDEEILRSASKIKNAAEGTSSRPSDNIKVTEKLNALKISEADITSVESSGEFFDELKRNTPKQFSPRDLRKFTSGLADKAGKGGFGSVYRGQFDDGVKIAVKVLEENDLVQKSFKAEVSTMFNTSHRNIVKFYGYCFDHNMKAIVYEYMENGSLDAVLYGNPFKLEWRKFYEISIETAKGLSYLHHECDHQILHHDLKPANILLDKTFSAKITDFGLARLIDKDQTHIPWTNCGGTIGYMAHEIFMPSSKITSKSDVYSFGMILFEVLRRKRNNDADSVWFPKQVWLKFHNGELEQLLDDCGIGEEEDRARAKRLCMVALWCSQFMSEARPSMREVVMMLETNIPIENPPNPCFN